jgi:hypothetical protein
MPSEPSTITPTTKAVAIPAITSGWVSVDVAAQFLSLAPGRLRRTLERRATRDADGHVVVSMDGIVARKLGRLWRLKFAACWTEPEAAGSTASATATGAES